MFNCVSLRYGILTEKKYLSELKHGFLLLGAQNKHETVSAQKLH